jgi:hypothetical protein
LQFAQDITKGWTLIEKHAFWLRFFSWK